MPFVTLVMGSAARGHIHPGPMMGVRVPYHGAFMGPGHLWGPEPEPELKLELEPWLWLMEPGALFMKTQHPVWRGAGDVVTPMEHVLFPFPDKEVEPKEDDGS